MAKRIGIVLDMHGRMFNPSSRKDDYLAAFIQKFEFILQNCDVVLQCGDIFEKPRTEDLVKNMILALLNIYRKPVYILPGNHDIENDRIDTINNTSLGNLICHPMVTLLTPDKIWNIEGLKVGVLDYDIEVAKKQAFSELDVLLGHHFYNWERDLSKSLVVEDISKYNAKHIFLGHDHEPHAPVQVGSTVIHRTGSVLRTELKAYTSQHIPCFSIIEVEGDNASEPASIEIPHTPFEEAFYYEEKKSFKKCTKLISDIKSFLENIDMQPENKKTVGLILKENLKAPKEVIDYLQLIYRVNHLQF